MLSEVPTTANICLRECVVRPTLDFATPIKCLSRQGLEIDCYCRTVDCLLVLNRIRISKFLFQIQVADWLRKPSEEIVGIEVKIVKYSVS